MKLLPWRFALLLFSFLRPPFLVAGGTYTTSCGKTGNYTANSTYEGNLQAATTYVTNEASFSGGNGFATTAYGEAPDVVYVLGICRGDTPDNLTCYECLFSASLEARTLCPDDKDATLFYDGCTVRFSDQDFLSSWDNTPEVVLNNTNTVKPTTAARSFDMLVGTLMEKIAEHAAASDAHDKKVATGEAVLDGDDPQMKIYGLAQCTPDMTSSGCGKCLRGEMDKMARRLRGSLGQRVAGVRCNLRFEVYPFYIGEAMVQIDATPAPSPAPTKSSPPPPPEPLTPASPPSKGGIHIKTFNYVVSR